MRNSLICTVGTSLLANIRRLPATEPLQIALASKNWKQLSLELLKIEGSDRVCGAEINSITSIAQEEILSQNKRLIFLVSDTEEGKQTGEILKLYYEHSSNPIQFDLIDKPRVLSGLRHDSVKDFQQKGLKSLVTEISKEARAFQPETLIINATGGYKAQISFAGMIGQALGIPVYYLFEYFSKVIKLPPQPVSLDLSLWLNHYTLFSDLAEEKLLPKSEIQSELESTDLISMLDEEKINDKVYVSLSAMGQLFHERCQLQFLSQEKVLLSLIPQDSTNPNFKSIQIRDDHGKDILDRFAKKICHSPYVTKIINSLPFNPNRSNPIRRAKSDGIVEFVLIWTDAGLGLCIQTTGRNKAETNSIAIHLKSEYSG